MWRKALGLVGTLLFAAQLSAQTVNINNTLSPPATTMQSAVTANGNGTSITTTGYGSLLLDVTCATCSGGTTINFEESADGSVWTAVYAYQAGTQATIGASTTATSMHQLAIGAGVRAVRARVSAYSAGTVTVKGYLGVPPFSFPGLNANVIGNVTVAQATAASLNATVVGTGTFVVQNTQAGTAAQNVTQLGGTAVSVTSGNKDNGTLRVTLATDQVQLTNALKVDGSAVTQPVSAVSLPLPTLAATSTKQSDGTQKTQIVDSVGAVIASTSNALNVQCANCSGSGVVTADEATFTAGTSSFAGAGGFFQTTATNNALTNGQQGLFQTTATRAIFSNLRNAAGTEVGTSTTPLQVSLANTAANATAVKVDGSAVTQPVSGTVTANAGTGSFSVVGTGIAGTPAGSILTVQGVASMTKLLVTPDSVALPANQSVNVAQVGGTNTINAGVSGVIAVGGNIANGVAATANPVPVGGVFTTSPATLSTGQTATMQFTAAQNMKNDLTTVAGTAVDTNSGSKSAGTMRVVIATDQPALTNKLLVTPDLPALASTSTKQSDGTQKTQIVDSVGAVIASTSNNLNVQCANCTGSGASAQDEASFTAGTSLFAPSGVFFQTTATNNALTTGQQGMLQATANRAAFVNFRNAAGTEIGTSTTPVQVSLANTGANTNKLLVTPDSVALPANQSVNVAQIAGTNTVTAGVSGLQAVGGNVANGVAATSNPVPVGGIFTTAPATLSTGQTATMQFTAAQNLKHDLTTLAGTAVDGNSGTKSAGTLRVVLATDQPALTNKLLVTPDSVALPANQSVNVNQLAGTTTDTNSGSKSAGTLRVVLATDQPALTNKLLVTPDSVALPANQSVNVSQINGVTPLMGNGASGTGAQRVTLANDSTGIIATVSAVTAITNALPAGTNTIGSVKQTDGTNVVITDPCQGQTKVYLPINQITGTTLITGTSAKKLYICSMFIFSATAQNLNLVEGTGTICATSIAGVTGGTTAGTGPNFAANQGWTEGNGAAAIMATATNADNLCLQQSGAGQVSGHISYAVQ